MERIDHDKSLTFRTIFKLLLPGHLLFLAPLSALLAWAVLRQHGMETGGEPVYGYGAVQSIVVLGTLIPVILAFWNSVAIMALQPLNGIAPGSLLSYHASAYKLMLGFGHRFLGLFAPPAVTYAEKRRGD